MSIARWMEAAVPLAAGLVLGAAAILIWLAPSRRAGQNGCRRREVEADHSLRTSGPPETPASPGLETMQSAATFVEGAPANGKDPAVPGSDPLRPVLECLLFVAGEPVPASRIAPVLGLEEAEVTAALDAMVERPPFAGLEVRRVAGGYQLVTRSDYASLIARFMQPAPQRLSRQAMETLTIIAYRQPITVPEIEAIRGVDSGGVVNTLLERGLIAEAGRRDAPGRPILYRTTDEFLKFVGLADLSELPPCEEVVNEPLGEARSV